MNWDWPEPPPTTRLGKANALVGGCAVVVAWACLGTVLVAFALAGLAGLLFAG